MKLRTLPLAFLLILGVVLGAASHANADYALWTPTTSNDQNLFSFTPTGCTMSGELYINAPGATQDTSSPGSALLLNMPGSWGNPYSGAAANFTVAETGSTWYVYSGNITGTPNPTNSILTLGSTDQFGLYYVESGVGVVQPVIYPQYNGSGTQLTDQWLLNTSDQCLPVFVADAAPNQEVGSATPIPGTFLLFGSGLAGAIGFLRRFTG